jgi:3-hydroxyacyl-CoA dehydrogenase/enoyl-CoA hydratase/3-hydroxybutyryl-CoA epimerase
MSKSKSNKRADGESAFKLNLRDDGIAIVEINVPGEPHNTLKAEFGADFGAVQKELAAASGLKGVIIVSTKPGSFVAGADINMIDAAKSVEDVEKMSRLCHEAFFELENTSVPVVAAIDGACLGGGMELALACHGRVAADNRKTVLGLPEVQLGLLPAGGGTQRMPRLIGIANALDLMLTGKQLNAQKAKKLGLVDEVVPPALLIEAATRKIAALARDGGFRKSERLSDRVQKHITKARKGLAAAQNEAVNMALEDNPVGRRVLFTQARKQALAKSKGNYPAVTKIIDCVAAGYGRSAKAGYDAEARAFGELAMSPASQELRNIFHATNTLKKETFIADKSVKERPIRHIGVLGAGLMGSGIALVTVNKAGLDVRLKDKDDKGLANGLGYLRKFYDKRVSRRAMTRFDADAQLRRATGTTDYSGFARCDMVVEAVFEDLKLKHKMVEDVEANANGNTIFASNTSSIPITKIADGAKRPENVIGLHYFSPVEKMPLLEIITTDKTAPEVIATSVAFGKAQGKTVIVVRDGPGFYTTRILSPYMGEATRILAEGVDPHAIDDAMVKFGFPVGPITLCDEVGIDVGAKIGPILQAAFGERMAPAGASDALIKAGFLGRKSGKGFYLYDSTQKGSKPVNTELYKLLGVKPGKAMDAQEIAERCVYMMLNEAVYCLQEGILHEAMHGDIGAIFGLGFPPFRGGPFRYIDREGAASVLARMEALADQHGPRFTPAPLLKEKAKKKQRFCA